MTILKKIRNIGILVFRYNVLKTVYLNLKWLPFAQAKHLPILIGKNVELRDVSGKFILNCVPTFGLFQVSSKFAPVDRKNKTVVIYNQGEIIVNGPVYIRSGVTIWVNPKGHMSFGGENNIGCDSVLVSYKKLSIGNNSGCSWNCQICDTSFHFFQDDNGNIISKRNGFVKIGDFVFIGNSCHLMKGTKLPDWSVVSNRSVVNCSFMKSGSNILISGNPAKVVETGIRKVVFGNGAFDFSEEERLAAIYD